MYFYKYHKYGLFTLRIHPLPHLLLQTVLVGFC